MKKKCNKSDAKYPYCQTLNLTRKLITEKYFLEKEISFLNNFQWVYQDKPVSKMLAMQA